MLPGCHLSSSIASGRQVSAVPYSLEPRCVSYDINFLQSAGHWNIEDAHILPHILDLSDCFLVVPFASFLYSLRFLYMKLNLEPS